MILYFFFFDLLIQFMNKFSDIESLQRELLCKKERSCACYLSNLKQIPELWPDTSESGEENHSISSATLFGLKSVLCAKSIAMPTFGFLFAWNFIFCPFTLSLCVNVELKWVFCRQHIKFSPVLFFFLNLCHHCVPFGWWVQSI